MPRNLALFALILLFAPVLLSDEPVMRMRLHDGSFSKGVLVPCEQDGHFGWFSEGFVDPFQFDLRTLRSVSLADAPEAEADEEFGYQVVMRDGAVLSGKLLYLDDSKVEIENKVLGKLTLNREHVMSLRDANFAGQIVYQGPIDEESWSPNAPTSWRFEAGTLVSETQGSVVIGRVNMPTKARIDLSMSWKGEPDFVFSFGTTATNQVSRAEQVPAAGRLEVWDKQLALVREVEGAADVALVSDLSGASPRVSLTLLIDQEKGSVTVCDSHGRPLDSVLAFGKREVTRQSVHLVNLGQSLTLESFEVREWDGLRNVDIGAENGNILNSKGETLEGTIRKFDRDRGTLTIDARTDDTPAEIPLEEVRRADLSLITVSSQDTGEQKKEKGTEEPKEKETAAANDEEQESQENGEAGDAELFRRVEVILLDRSRFNAELWPSEPGQAALVLAADGVTSAYDDSRIRCSTSQIRGLIGRSKRFVPNAPEHRLGTIKLGETQLAGFLIEETPSDAAYALHWQPAGSRVASALSDSASGAVVYRRQLPRVVRQGKAKKPAAPLMDIFGSTFSGNKERKDAPASEEERQIMFRTGDGIDGVVERIDQQGLHFRSAQTETKFAEHAQVQSVELNAKVSGPSFKAELLERLKTVPRSMRDSPPTHLFLSVNGDYLRGRLIELNDVSAKVEIRLEIQEVPRDRIAQIIWLHDRKWEKDEAAEGGEADEAADEKVAKNLPPFRVHAIGIAEKGLTFEPSAMRNNELIGNSELLGECSIGIPKVMQILFGRNIGERVREYNEDPWVLSLAQFPKVYLDDGEGAGDPSMGTSSALVGQSAPAFGLKTLDGKNFVLSQNRDRVVVLDFWASWCGPCMQTMPLVEEMVEELGTDKVNLVPVNIQESENRVQAAVERLGLKDATVLMDVDGEVAAAYQANAIPQTVIVNQKGMVTHVFVGGGTRMVASLEAALREVLELEEPTPSLE